MKCYSYQVEPVMVENEGVEPSFRTCKACVLATERIPHMDTVCFFIASLPVKQPNISRLFNDRSFSIIYIPVEQDNWRSMPESNWRSARDRGKS